MELEAKFEALGAVMSRGFRIASGQDAIDEIGHLVVKGVAPAGLEAFLGFLENSGLRELGDVVFARHVVDAQRALGADDLGLDMAAGMSPADLDVGGRLIVELCQGETIVVIAVIGKAGADIGAPVAKLSAGSPSRNQRARSVSWLPISMNHGT